MQHLIFVTFYSRQISELGLIFKTVALETEKLHLAQYRHSVSLKTWPLLIQVLLLPVLWTCATAPIHSCLSAQFPIYDPSPASLPLFQRSLHSQQLHYTIYCSHSATGVPLASSSPILALLLISQLSAPSTDLLGFPNRFSPLNVFPTSLLPHSLLMLGSCPANFQISSQ